MTLQIELASLRNESDVFSVERRQKVEADLAAKREEASKLTSIWKTGTCLNQLVTYFIISDFVRKSKAGPHKGC